MHYVYILVSKRDNKLYVGCTSNLENRIANHNSGSVEATKNRLPLEIIHIEKFESATDAFVREKFLKSLWAARFKKKLKEKYLIQQQEPKII